VLLFNKKGLNMFHWFKRKRPKPVDTQQYYDSGYADGYKEGVQQGRRRLKTQVTDLLKALEEEVKNLS
jgi:flagellar biosynthesis/type III secretory pathway protein FliH